MSVTNFASKEDDAFFVKHMAFNVETAFNSVAVKNMNELLTAYALQREPVEAVTSSVKSAFKKIEKTSSALRIEVLNSIESIVEGHNVINDVQKAVLHLELTGIRQSILQS